MQLVLLYFDKHIGPKVFFAFPSEISEKLQETIINLMDITRGDSFFEYRMGGMFKSRIINYMFTLESQWARGNEEMLMISAIFDRKIDLFMLEFRLKKIVENLINIPKIYKAFYYHSKKDEDPEVSLLYEKAKDIFQEGYEILKKKVQQLEILDQLFHSKPITKNTKSQQFFESLVNTFITSIDARLPDGGVLLFNTGNRMARKIQNIFVAIESEGLLQELRQFFRRYDLGQIEDVIIDEHGFSFCINRCFECSHVISSLGQNMCKFTEGFLSGIIQAKIGENYAVWEHECFANGAKACKFILQKKPDD